MRCSSPKCSATNKSGYKTKPLACLSDQSLTLNPAGGAEFRPTFAAVSHIKPASQYVAGLIAELVGQPGVGTALVTVRRPTQASWTHGKLPHGSPGPASDPCRKPAAGRTTCRRKPEKSDEGNVHGGKSNGDVGLRTETVTAVPVAGRVVARFVAVAVFDPRPRAALGTVWHGPCEVNLG